MAAVVATMVVGPLVKIVMEKVSNYLLDQYKVMKGMEEQHEILKRKLPAILDIITDAEQAATHREGVAAWLEAIKKVAYQASEVFDEFKYEALRRQAKKKGHYKELGFHVIVHTIKVLVTEMNAFGFKYQQQPPVSSQLRRKGPANTDPKEIMEIIRKSRANDKSAIVSRLVGQAKNADLTVVPIVGMGGLGKTTLAQLVYKESIIQEHFGLLIWVCASECYDVDSLAKRIVEAAPEKKDGATKAVFEKEKDGRKTSAFKNKDDGTEATAMSRKTLLDNLQNVVSGQKYLLVLDDVWERQVHIWHELKAFLQHGERVSVMKNECALATEEPDKIESVVTTEEPSQSEWLPNTARHLFLSCKDPGKKLNISLESSFPAIQTLLCDSSMSSSLQHLSKYSSLQALQLCSARRTFLLKPKYLHHLRYLDLSRSRFIKALPEDISILYNLQTLNLSGCTSLCELPRQMKYMTALRHLYTHGCPELKSMPRDLRKLTSLQTLTCFVAGSDPNCSNVGELGNLNLGGQLELRNLANVTEVDARAANLVNKELRRLTLTWTFRWNYFGDQNCWRDDKEDARVLQNLKPHDGLHAILINSYGATTFPTWMAMLQNIVQIHLFSCRKLVWLFSGECDTSFAFPNLKELMLKDLVCLKRWWEIDNDGMQGAALMFPLLEKLHISNCVKLKALPGHLTFPKLQNVCIQRCPKLTTTAKSPKLSVLNMEGHEAELFLWVARHMTSLTNLELTSIEHSTDTTSMGAENSLRELVNVKENGNAQDFPLEVLVLRDFKPGVTELCACFVHLQDLSVVRCHELIHWPETLFQGLVSLRKLLIGWCANLTGYAQPSYEPSTSSETSQLLPRLESLTIRSCKNMVELFNVPASLRKMYIYDCSKLESIYGRKLQQGQSISFIRQGSSSIEKLSLYYCDGLTGALYVPPSLKILKIDNCDGLASLEYRYPEFHSLELLELKECKTLESLPERAYSSLRFLAIRDCPGLKTLPASLQQRLGSIQEEHVEARLYRSKPMLLKPKT
ncbi:putative disease resistance protein RGA4 [Triticum aestivum]|uniref:putative disease resistance protein RGA4 n=1 Tax=Triticum aestivum TaxID=4565 RepID=UPI001D02BB24|nr:putative disease resistance protein RGA4 [Triticum aestivum]